MRDRDAPMPKFITPSSLPAPTELLREMPAERFRQGSELGIRAKKGDGALAVHWRCANGILAVSAPQSTGLGRK